MAKAKPTQNWRAMGYLNRARGEAFEEQIKTACEYYRYINAADIEKTPEPMKVVEPLGKGRFVCYFEKKAQPDFRGTLKGGRAIMFDAKYTSAGEMHKKEITDEQAKKLTMNQALGGLSFVLVSFGPRDGTFRIPWKAWLRMKEELGHAYFTPADAVDYKIQIGRTGALMFLDGLEELG